MLTRNFYTALYTCMTKQTLENAIATTTNNAQNSSLDSPTYGTANYPNNVLQCFFSKTVCTANSPNVNSVAFGTGNTPPSLSDYWLSGNLITDIAIVGQGITRANTDGGVSFTSKLTVENTGSDTIVINEMAIIALCYKGGNSTGPAMLDRTVLDTPLTLAPGEQGTIDYKINLPF